MIYITEFVTEGDHRRAIGPSTDSGMDCLDTVVVLMGDEYLTRGPRQIIYPGVAFSDHAHFGVIK